MGAKVIAAASTDEKLALCREYGADETINYKEEDLKKRIKELTDGNGADVVYDPVGGDYTEAALRAMLCSKAVRLWVFFGGVLLCVFRMTICKIRSNSFKCMLKAN